MLDGKFEIFDDARDFMARTRPVFIEKHDFSAKLFKNREADEPSFSFATKGGHTFDLYKIVCGAALFFLWLTSMRIYFGMRRARRKKRKERRRAAKARR